MGKKFCQLTKKHVNFQWKYVNQRQKWDSTQNNASREDELFGQLLEQQGNQGGYSLGNILITIKIFKSSDLESF